MTADPKHERRAREYLTSTMDQFSDDADNVASLTALLTSVAAEARAEALEEAAVVARHGCGNILAEEIRALKEKEKKHETMAN